jgi:hypothetical protein
MTHDLADLQCFVRPKTLAAAEPNQLLKSPLAVALMIPTAVVVVSGEDVRKRSGSV